MLTSQRFFDTWCQIATEGKDRLLGSWEDSKEYTRTILAADDGLIKKLARKLQLHSYSYGRSGYYWMDAVLYDTQDLIPPPLAPMGETWLRGIRVAIEHENDFHSVSLRKLGTS